MTVRVVFFADVLGFGALASRPGAAGAVDALADLAQVLSSDNEVARLVRADVWAERYGLSDSIFLVADEPKAACAAAAELFFNLAYLSVDAPLPLLLRGAVTSGEVRRTGPLFPESGSANLVGRAVVEAVAIEGSGAKGPRLMLSEASAQALRDDRCTAEGWWSLDRTENGVVEILWPLPPGSPRESGRANGTMVGELCGAAADLLVRYGRDPGIGPHYAAYLGVTLRALLRLKQHDPEGADRALEAARLEEKRPQIMSFLRKATDPRLDGLQAYLKTLLS